MVLNVRGGPTWRRFLFDWLPIIAYAFLALGPVIILSIITLQALFTGSMDWLSLALPVGRRLGLFINSIALAMSVSFVSIILGFFIAVILWSRGGKWSGAIVLLVIPLAFIPPYIHAMTWFAFVDTLRDLISPFGLSLRVLQGWSASFWVEVTTFTPIAIGCAWLGLRSIDPDLIEVGRTSRSDFKALWYIALPPCLPALLTGGIIVFLFSLLDYSVPSLLQVHVYAMEIFAEFSATNYIERALILSLPLMLVAVIAVAMLLKPLQTLTLRKTYFNRAWNTPPQWPGWFNGLIWTLAAFVILQACVLLVLMISLSGGVLGIANSLEGAKGEFFYSMQSAILAALICVPLAAATANALLSTKEFNSIKWALVVSPLAIPASLIGIGMILLTNLPVFRAKQLAYVMPVFAYIARFAPLAVLIFVAQMRRMDFLLLDAAYVFQANRLHRLTQIIVPMLTPGILVAVGLVFALSLGELGATIMIVPPGYATLTMRIYNYLHYGASDTVAGLCLVIIAGVFAAGVLAGLSALLWSHLFSQPRID